MSGEDKALVLLWMCVIGMFISLLMKSETGATYFTGGAIALIAARFAGTYELKKPAKINTSAGHPNG